MIYSSLRTSKKDVKILQSQGLKVKNFQSGFCNMLEKYVKNYLPEINQGEFTFVEMFVTCHFKITEESIRKANI